MTEDANISKLIYQAIEESARKAIEEEMEGVKKRVEEKVRGQVGMIAARVLDRFSFERVGQTLRIEVNFENTTKT